MYVNKVVEFVLAHGFKLRAGVYKHPDGHVLMIEGCDFAAKWRDGSTTHCLSGRWASYHNMSPEDYGVMWLEQYFHAHRVTKRKTNRPKRT